MYVWLLSLTGNPESGGTGLNDNRRKRAACEGQITLSNVPQVMISGWNLPVKHTTQHVTIKGLVAQRACFSDFPLASGLGPVHTETIFVGENADRPNGSGVFAARKHTFPTSQGG